MPNDNYPHADVAKQDVKNAGANPKEVRSESQADGTGANAPRGETQAQPRSNQAVDPASPTRGTEGGENRPQASQGTSEGRPQNTGADANRMEAKSEKRDKGHGKDQEFGEAVDIGQDNHGLGDNLNPKDAESKVPAAKGGENPSETQPGREGASAERGAPESDMGGQKREKKDEAA